MPFQLAPALTENEWKKHKAALATDTKVSAKLRDLKTAADKYDATKRPEVETLHGALETVRSHALTTAKGLSPAFAKTKKYLEDMAAAAAKHKTVVQSQITRHDGLEE